MTDRDKAKQLMTIQEAINVLRDCKAYGTMDIAKSVILDYFNNENVLTIPEQLAELKEIEAEIEKLYVDIVNDDLELGNNRAVYDSIKIIKKHIEKRGDR